MTDRELLELAAKAVGLAAMGAHYVDRVFVNLLVLEKQQVATEPALFSWNPLSDDGDALRLAVSLKIDTLHRSEVWATLAGKGLQLSETYNEDPNAATRRAIVRAAAEIGRAML